MYKYYLEGLEYCNRVLSARWCVFQSTQATEFVVALIFHANLHIVLVHSLFNALKRPMGIDCTLHLVTLHTALKGSNTDSTVVEFRG